MLKFYLVTVIIWMIIIYCIVAMFQDSIVKKLGAREGKKDSLFKKLKALFVLAAVPIVRLLVVIGIIYIAICKQEDFDELMKKANKS